MATTIRFKPLLPLSLLPKQQTNSPLTSCLSLPISRPRGYVAVSVAFNPQGNFDVSLFDDDGNNNNNNNTFVYCITPITC
jgi:hypothetical protein